MTPGVRLRPAPTPAELAAMYPAPHQHAHFGAGHDLRVRVSTAVGRWLAVDCDAATVADLSCGDGAIALGSLPPSQSTAAVLGDLAPGWPICGPIEDTLPDLAPVDLFVCTETLEHIDDPAGVLETVRGKARRLLVSFPHRGDLDDNPEHVWQWSPWDAGDLLGGAGWEAATWLHLEVPDGPYSYTIWGCR